MLEKIQEHEYALSADLQAELISVEQPTRRSLPATGSIESPTKEDYDLINEVIAISAEHGLPYPAGQRRRIISSLG